MAKIQGLENLRKKLRALPAEVRKGMADALAQSADEITEMQRRLSHSKRTRDSIGWVFGEPPQTARLGGKTGRKKPSAAEIEDSRQDLRITIFAGDDEAFWARWDEFGTKPHPQGGIFKGTMHPGTAARPFFYPGYRANRKKVKSRVSRSITKAAKKVAST